MWCQLANQIHAFRHTKRFDSETFFIKNLFIYYDSILRTFWGFLQVLQTFTSHSEPWWILIQWKRLCRPSPLLDRVHSFFYSSLQFWTSNGDFLIHFVGGWDWSLNMSEGIGSQTITVTAFLQTHQSCRSHSAASMMSAGWNTLASTAYIKTLSGCFHFAQRVGKCVSVWQVHLCCRALFYAPCLCTRL